MRQLAHKKIVQNNYLLVVICALLIATACTVTPVSKVRADVVDSVMAELSRLEKSGSATAQEWYELAVKAREAGDSGAARMALDRAVTAGISPVRAGIERARQGLAVNDTSAAINALQALFDQGFNAVGVLTADPVINALAGNDDYDALISAMSMQAYPCAHHERFADFDFWLGEWDVHLADGTFAGSNVIEREERGCVMLEHWTSASGGTGMSINYPDLATDEWVQTWIAEGGTQINIRGGLRDEGMSMSGTIHYVANGQTLPFRGLWTPLPDGRVRQYFEQSDDGGNNWQPWFEGFYTRKQ